MFHPRIHRHGAYKENFIPYVTAYLQENAWQYL